MAKNNKTRFFYVLYSDKTRVFDQSERAYYPIYIIICHIRVRPPARERLLRLFVCKFAYLYNIFPSDSLRLGVVKNFTIQLTVENKAADSAYTSKITLKYPDALNYIGPDEVQ